MCLHRQGLSLRQIARQLGLVLGMTLILRNLLILRLP